MRNFLKLHFKNAYYYIIYKKITGEIRTGTSIAVSYELKTGMSNIIPSGIQLQTITSACTVIGYLTWIVIIFIIIIN